MYYLSHHLFSYSLLLTILPGAIHFSFMLSGLGTHEGKTQTIISMFSSSTEDVLWESNKDGIHEQEQHLLHSESRFITALSEVTSAHFRSCLRRRWSLCDSVCDFSVAAGGKTAETQHDHRDEAGRLTRTEAELCCAAEPLGTLQNYDCQCTV